jgi:uncharacterized caspase-like protein
MNLKIMAFLLSMIIIFGCATRQTNVKIPKGSSSVLNVRKDQFREIDRKYSYNDASKQNEETDYSSLRKEYNKSSNTKLTSLHDANTYQNDKKKLALVIGNSAYQNGLNLNNPSNDADAMASALDRLGFHVVKFVDMSQKQMKKEIDSFGYKLQSYDVGLFFYAGHGIQANGRNYLIPTDAIIETENDVEYNCVDAGRILAKMEDSGTQTNIIILDACRDNPFERTWSRGVKSKGLAFMDAPSGTIIAYATSPGNTASDGKGQNGVYTLAILNHIQTPNITIEEMFKKVRVEVEEQTQKKQTPWESTSLRGNFYFNFLNSD